MLTPINSCHSFSHPQFMSKKKGKKVFEKKDTTTKPLIITGATMAVAFGVTAAIISNKQHSTKLANEIIAIKNEMSKFTEDIAYRKNILKDMNLPQSDYYKLYSILGPEELDNVVKKLLELIWNQFLQERMLKVANFLQICICIHIIPMAH